MSVVIELDEKLVAEIDDAAKVFNQNRLQFINESLQNYLRSEIVQKKRTDAEKVKRFVESYEKFPQQPEEYEIWQDEQVWEDE